MLAKTRHPAAHGRVFYYYLHLTIWSSSYHTYGPTCRLAPKVGPKGSNRNGEPPPLTAQFFYTSPLPIDDPLSVSPTPGSFDAKIAKHTPRPFSAYDNNALEEAWFKVFSKTDEDSDSKPSDELHKPWIRGTTDGSSPIGTNEESKTASVISQTDLESPNGDSRNHSPRSISLARDISYVQRCMEQENYDKGTEVPVGISRLHLVKLPSLQMMPIYWSPVHDVAAVTRGTWFYKDTMYPVEPAVANQLEIGYMDSSPWSKMWDNRLSKALDNGNGGEMDVLYKLWSDNKVEEIDGKRKQGELPGLENSTNAANHFYGNVATAGTLDAILQDGKTTEEEEPDQTYPDSSVFYTDEQNAFILGPSLQPPGFLGRRLLSMIRNGTSVGIQVVRGFDWQAWETLHPSKKSASDVQAEEFSPVAETLDHGEVSVCPDCAKDQKRPKVTDLILVIHGIGQKFSERVESFNFTHAINGLRRSINADISNDSVQDLLRKDLGGVMALPVNWRSNLSFEPGRSNASGNKAEPITASKNFLLKDVTQDTIPAVRNIISDILLDIPFYMSTHKPEMIDAVIREGNRIYQLWCHNNPGFQNEGRVHIIGHSLGSALAIDVMSSQPTTVPPLDLQKKNIQSKHFDFNTKNLFLIGSPVGFFLLLERGNLVPRRDRKKPGVNLADDSNRNITGEEGNFGCLAVDNLYNIMHFNDPVAYRLNATVDPLYAASLKNALVPSATSGWFDTISNAVQSIKRSDTVLTDLEPRTSEEHLVADDMSDQERMEIAEKKFYLLNDNGQVDYSLRPDAGPDIQYLNMLWAHTTYWSNADFVRLVVTEVGRQQGKEFALPSMKAVKNVPGVDDESIPES